MASDYFNIDGQPISMWEWAALFSVKEYQRVRHTTLFDGAVTVSTVWLGLNHAFSGGPPMIFETMIFGGPLDSYQERYATLAEAIEGHAQAVEAAEGVGKTLEVDE